MVFYKKIISSSHFFFFFDNNTTTCTAISSHSCPKFLRRACNFLCYSSFFFLSSQKTGCQIHNIIDSKLRGAKKTHFFLFLCYVQYACYSFLQYFSQKEKTERAIFIFQHQGHGTMIRVGLSRSYFFLSFSRLLDYYTFQLNVFTWIYLNNIIPGRRTSERAFIIIHELIYTHTTHVLFVIIGHKKKKNYAGRKSFMVPESIILWSL